MVTSHTFSKEDQQAISEAVRQAEKSTSAEIVPVVATTSDVYERAEDLIGLATALIALSAVWALFQRVRPSFDWDGESELLVHLPIVLTTVLGGWIAGVLLAKGIPSLKRLAVSHRAMKARVLIAAHHAFDSLHVDKTNSGTGVVIYVSLFEKLVCVWADRSISAMIPESEWKGIAKILTQALRHGTQREGLIEAVRKTGELLAISVPLKPGDTNELTNELRILD